MSEGSLEQRNDMDLSESDEDECTSGAMSLKVSPLDQDLPAYGQPEQSKQVDD